jgi:hypothetical protein
MLLPRCLIYVHIHILTRVDGSVKNPPALGRIPLQVAPADPEVREKLAAFTEKYGYEFAELAPER